MREVGLRIDALRRFAVLGLAQRDDAALRAISERIFVWIETTDATTTLDDALGLSPEVGQAHWKTIRARTERNIFLRLAAAKFAPHHSAKHAAQVIHEAWTAYLHVGWPRDRQLLCTPDHLEGRIEEMFFRVMRVWPAVLSPRQIEAVLSANSREK